MKVIYLILFILLSSFINIKSDSISANFTTAGEGYTISGDILTITGEGTYNFSGYYTNKKIIVSSSCKLNFRGFTINNNESLTPLVISENKVVEIVLFSYSDLFDSKTNENNGTIYLESGASLIISGTGNLCIYPNKSMAINGSDETSLIVNDRAYIHIETQSKTIGGIYLGKSITFNNARLVYNGAKWGLSYYGQKGGNHAIESGGDIKIIKGYYNIASEKGKGIKYIYSGSIEIKAGDYVIIATSSGTDCDETVQCSGNCACYISIEGGMLQATAREDGLNANGDIFISGGIIIVFSNSIDDYQPIDGDGILKIAGGIVIAGGSRYGEVNAQTNQIEKIYRGVITSGDNITINDDLESEIYSFEALKSASYIYFNYESFFTVKKNGLQLNLSDPSQNQQQNTQNISDIQGGSDIQVQQNGNSKGEEFNDNLGNFLGLPNILFLFGIFILYPI